MPTLQVIQATQGTRKSDVAPWDTYGEELELNLPDELEAEIAEYAKHRYEDAPVSSQTQEELCRLREGNEEAAKEYQFVAPDEYENEEERTGTPLDHNTFLSKLKNIKNGVTWVYLTHPHPDKAILAYSQNGGPLQTACWVQLGWMIELSVVRFDERGTPINEKKRGYRTCLLQILLKGLLTEEQINKEFGKPKTTPAWDRYNKTLYEWRKRSNGWETD